MSSKKARTYPIALLKGAVDTLVTNPIILFPFLIIGFIQLFILEVLYFSTRFPLSGFFNPIIRTLWGEKFTHYPHNIVIIPKLFQYFQVPMYIFVSSFLIGVAVTTIAGLNRDKKIGFSLACRDTLKQYVHICAGGVISFCAFYGFYRLYNLLKVKALNHSAVDGFLFMMRNIIVQGTLYINFLIGIFVTVIFAFVLPVIIIEKKKIISAIWINFKNLFGSFWFVFLVVLIPTLLYLPIKILRSNVDGIVDATFPEIRVIMMGMSIILAMLIDAVIFTAITMYYLLKKERL